MSILNKQTIKKYSNRKITNSFLKKHGFYADRWGGPRDRQLPTSVFYEAMYADGIGIVRKKRRCIFNTSNNCILSRRF